jgi:hypothetical protein
MLNDLDAFRAVNACLFAIAGLLFLFTAMVGPHANAPRAQRARFAGYTITLLAVAFTYVTAAAAPGKFPPVTVGSYTILFAGLLSVFAAVLTIIDKD